MWCGCEGGQICVFSLDTGSLIKTIKAHSDTVDTLAVVGNQVGQLCGAGCVEQALKGGPFPRGSIVFGATTPLPPPLPPLPSHRIGLERLS